MSKKIKQHIIEPDIVYDNIDVSKLINHIMIGGNKSIARKIVYNAFKIVKEKTKKEPLEVFELAIENVGPMLEVKSKRVGGATYQVPREVRGDRRQALAMRWIIHFAKAAKGKTMGEKLAKELIDASDKVGSAVKKRDNTHRMAEANRAFAHFRW
ncbi:MAG: 30S ribosomal protein S7 [Patescibacteria group bacterium]|nr:30S ribosomal protein S7 [Patescibacteria group bacterium]